MIDVGKFMQAIGAPSLLAFFPFREKWGWETVFYATSALLLIWAIVYAALARNPVGAARPASAAAMIADMRAMRAPYV